MQNKLNFGVDLLGSSLNCHYYTKRRFNFKQSTKPIEADAITSVLILGASAV